jgi:hypothetical protein
MSFGGQRMFRRLSVEQRRNVFHWAMEFVVVVAGVLLALGLQQWDQRRRAVADMRAAELVLHDEIRETLKSLIWREAISKCHHDRAELLQSRLLATRARWPGLDENALFTNLGTLPGTIARSVYHRPLDSFSDSAWTAALATGVLAPMDRQRFAILVGIYDSIHFLQKSRELEDRAATKLSPLGFELEVTPEIRAEMLGAIYDVDRVRFTFALISPDQFAASMRQLGWVDTAEIDRSIVENTRDALGRGLKFRPCVARERNPFRTVPVAG